MALFPPFAPFACGQATPNKEPSGFAKRRPVAWGTVRFPTIPNFPPPFPPKQESVSLPSPLLIISSPQMALDIFCAAPSGELRLDLTAYKRRQSIGQTDLPHWIAEDRLKPYIADKAEAELER